MSPEIAALLLVVASAAAALLWLNHALNRALCLPPRRRGWFS